MNNPNNGNTITTLRACAMVVFALALWACGPPLLVVVDCDDEGASGDTGATGDTGGTGEVLYDVLEGDGDGDPAGDGDTVPLDLPDGDGDGDVGGECACVDPSPGDGDGDPAGGGGGWGCGCGAGGSDSFCYNPFQCAYFVGGCPEGWKPICADA